MSINYQEKNCEFPHYSSPPLLSQTPAKKTTLLLLTAAVSLVLAFPVELVAPTKEAEAMRKRDIADIDGNPFAHEFLQDAPTDGSGRLGERNNVIVDCDCEKSGGENCAPSDATISILTCLDIIDDNALH